MPNDADRNNRTSTMGESTCSSMKQNATSRQQTEGDRPQH